MTDQIEQLISEREGREQDFFKSEQKADAFQAQLTNQSEAVMAIQADAALRQQIDAIQKAERERVKLVISAIGMACGEGSEGRRVCEQVIAGVEALGIKIEPQKPSEPAD